MAEIPQAPRATYRLQFNKDFKFEDAARVAPYLSLLGISHVYASPYLKARAGSTHGYDITDHNAFNPEIGDDAAFEAFADTLDRNALGQVLDFVPNHMGIGRDDNAWWLDVLEWGEESPYAGYFDIDWNPAKPELQGKVLLPVLGDHYGRILEAGDLRLTFDAAAGAFDIRYFEHRFPIAPTAYDKILKQVQRRYSRPAGNGEAAQAVDGEACAALSDLIAELRDLRDWAKPTGDASGRRGEGERLKQQLADIVGAEGTALTDAIERTLAELNAVDDPDTLQWKHALLEAQHYRLAHWRVAAEEINYRRFFQINELAGIRVEQENVFEDTHRLVLDLIRRGRVHGLRIDHVDGLFDPKQYLQRLQERAQAELAARGSNGNSNGAKLFWVVVEKILAAHERLREDWQVAGTTGYEFLNLVNGLFLDPAGEGALQRTYERFIDEPMDFEDTAYHCRRQVMDFELASELRVLANEYNHLTETSWLTRDYTLVGLRQALREVAACFPVYRTYVDGDGATAEDRRQIDWAVGVARRRSVRADKSVFDFLQAALSTDLAAGTGPFSRREVRRLAMKFQQYTGPVAAKGVEDTAFYRYNRLISVNEVGGEPQRFGVTVAAFHKAMKDVARQWPDTMLATATHDTKRGEDARARINVLSEIPVEWGRRVRRWATLNSRRKGMVNDEPAPTANDEYLYYQALVGVWPAEFADAARLDADAVAALRERVSTYMIKAVREAKTHSSWINPNSEYEEALLRLITQTLDASRPNPFLADFREFHAAVAMPGVVNSLAQTAIKLTAPGVPDIYQGCELWDFSLVDPDNRRPVDFEDRMQRLSRIEEAFKQQGERLAADLLRDWTDGTVKLFVVWRLLALRRTHPSLFRDAGYQPVESEGALADNICAFIRASGDTQVLIVAPRLSARLTVIRHWPVGDLWGDTALALPPSATGAAWEDVFTGRRLTAESDGDDDGGRLPVADLFADFPVAVLVQQAGEASAW